MTDVHEQCTPIGYIRSQAVRRSDAPRQGVLQPAAPALLRLEHGRNFEQALEGLAGFERIWLLYMFHLNEHWKPKVHVPRGPEEKVGVFATRAPYRPNPIGLSCVRLDEVRGLELHLGECDLLDGTPVLDIKPYLPYADAFPDAATGWLEHAEDRRFHVHFSDLARGQLLYLKERGIGDLDDIVCRHLEYRPYDNRSKRVRQMADGGWVLAWRTWRVLFSQEQENALLVRALRSGYSASELADQDDPYGDKRHHADFINAFPYEVPL